MTEAIGFRLQVACDNAAFDEGMATELARICRDVATRLEAGEDFSKYRNVRDSNGNIVGAVKLAPKSEL